MKKYRLKQWYPSLHEDIEEGIEVEYKDGWIYYVNTRGNKTCVEFDLNEFIFTDFWEEVKQPLFITEDGVECFDRDGIVWLVRNNNFDKIKIHSIHLNDYDFEHKVFFHESSADEYIWRNKRVFNYKDMMKAKHSIILTYEDIEKAAKERSKK